MKLLGVILVLFGAASLILPRITEANLYVFNWMGNWGASTSTIIQWGILALGILLALAGMMMKRGSSDM